MQGSRRGSSCLLLLLKSPVVLKLMLLELLRADDDRGEVDILLLRVVVAQVELLVLSVPGQGVGVVDAVGDLLGRRLLLLGCCWRGGRQGRRRGSPLLLLLLHGEKHFLIWRSLPLLLLLPLSLFMRGPFGALC